MSAVAVHELSLVLDDDAAGAAAAHDLRALREGATARVRAALADGAHAVRLTTGARALPAARARVVTAAAAAAGRLAAPHARVVLRADATLSGHLLEEYRAVDPAGFSVLLLVPAPPADGARLLAWAQERSGGVFDAGRGAAVPLARLREQGGEAVAAALARAAATRAPAVCAPDAETADDLELIADGLRRAEGRGIAVTVRCARPFADVLAGDPTAARRPAPATPGPGRRARTQAGEW